MGLLAGMVLMMGCVSSLPSVAKPKQRTAEAMEAAEFAELMKQDSLNKDRVVAESLDLLLNEEVSSRRISVMINNHTDCNIIVRFSGDRFYSLPIAKRSKNFIIIEKGDYVLGANLCRARYTVSKTFTDSVTMTLSEQ